MEASVQLFTVRRQAQKDLYATLARLSGMGVQNVEAARIPFTGETAGVFVRAKAELGLSALSSQIKLGQLEDDFDEIIRWHHTTNCRLATVSVMPTPYILNRRPVAELAERLNRLQPRFAAEGITLGYHHHDFELEKQGGADKLSTLIDGTALPFVVDSYWAQKAGWTPERLLRRLAGRVLGLHLRDYGVIFKGWRCMAKDFAAGQGNLDIASVLAAAKEAGAAYFAIEQNTQAPYEELQTSLTYLDTLQWRETP